MLPASVRGALAALQIDLAPLRNYETFVHVKIAIHPHNNLNNSTLNPQNNTDMCTISLSYNPSDALAQLKLDELLATGLFTRVESRADWELRELERRMDAYERGEMGTVQQGEVYNRVMASL